MEHEQQVFLTPIENKDSFSEAFRKKYTEHYPRKMDNI